MSTSSQAIGGRGHRSRLPRATLPLTALLFAVTVVSSCTVASDSGSGGGGTSLCGGAFAVAAAIDPTETSKADLDMAIKRCRSLDEWADASAEHPDALRGVSPDRLLEERCADPSAGLARYQLCGLVRAAHATPTPKPTPRPTPRPTKAPPWPVRAWAAFREHYYRVESRGVNLIYRAIEGVQSSTFRSRGPRWPMEALRAWATSELRWLDRHPPHRCYSTVQRAWRKGVSYVAQATRQLVPGFRQGSKPKLDRGVVLLDQASAWFTKADKRFSSLGPNGCE